MSEREWGGWRPLRSSRKGWWLVVLATGCISTSYTEPLAPPGMPAIPDGPRSAATISVHQMRQELEVVAGPFDVPPTPEGMGEHDHGGMAHGEGSAGTGAEMYSPLVVFRWPVDGGLAGVRLALRAADGRELPRAVLHHVIGVHFDRRQLVYPVSERLFGFGTETPDVKLPSSLEIPIGRGDSIGIYAMWHNDSGETLHDVYLHVVLPYAGAGEDREKALPVYFDTNNQVGGKTSFDLPPGHSTQAYEFELPVGGELLAAGGHLHDYGRELRIEEVATGRVLVRLEPELDEEGHVLRVEQRVFRRLFNLLDARIPLRQGVRYRVVGEYDNPTGETIPDGGMAHVVGLFVPDDLALWPHVDRSAQLYRTDLEALPPRLPARPVQPDAESGG